MLLPRDNQLNFSFMVTYMNEQGSLREFGEICVLGVKNGFADVIQHLSTTKDNVQSFERRTALLPTKEGESLTQVAERLNSDDNFVINTSGELVKITMA